MNKCIKMELVTPAAGDRKAEYRATFEPDIIGRTMSSFKEGESYDIVIEERSNAQGKYKYIKKADSGKFGGGGWKKDMVGLIVSTGLSYIKDLIILDMFRGKKMDEMAEGIIQPMLQAEKAMLTTRDKEYVSYCMSYAIDVYKDDMVRNMYFDNLPKLDRNDYKMHLELIVMIYRQMLALCVKLSKDA